ncbi:TetR/AcrR family transcriptional regulator [Mycobacterium sp. 21AC1]|uniref:helix-turn-helix domain-containing protein n=1 Tax=[Mycobacterium] appelbergii TaxID=2939269 RepID=UPI00293942A1|nr:helix-turn-helix domain-containing protein [Mycobacterium sp. 21AC1]MDV3126591.1 TetR/AcrR family transcriptional regulator [Mycobacterium sp. 21AC1]
MTEQLDRRADLTRLQILRAASRQFAHKPYSLVSLDDILADAAVTKGALYFHFRSKHALASSIVDHRAEQARVTVAEVLARNLSGLETLIDISYLLAVDDISETMARAGLNLVESIGRMDNLGPRMLDSWAQGFTEIGRRAVTEGDLAADSDPGAMARLLVAMYMGIRQTSDLDVPARFLTDLEQAWNLILPSFVSPDRLSYLTQFIRRRTALAIRNAAPLLPDEPAVRRDGTA